MNNKIILRIDIHSKYAIDNFLFPVLELLEKTQYSASFYTYFATANRQLQNKFFWQYIQQTNARKHYNLRTILAIYQAKVANLANHLPVTKILEANCQVGMLLATNREWNKTFAPIFVEQETEFIKNSISNFQRYFPKEGLTFAAAHWQLSRQSWRILERLQAKYISATQGTQVYLPRWQGELFSTPEMPSTLPEIHSNEVEGNFYQHIIEKVKSNSSNLNSDLPTTKYHLLRLDLESIGQTGKNGQVSQKNWQDFVQFLIDCQEQQIEITSIFSQEEKLLKQKLPICDLELLNNSSNLSNSPKSNKQQDAYIFLKQGKQIANDASLHLLRLINANEDKI